MKKIGIVLNGVKYNYYDDTGMLIEDILSQDEINQKVDDKTYNCSYIENFENNMNYFNDNNITRNVDKSVLENFFNTSGYTELILKTTEECNLRCKYCVYSEHYPYTDSFGKSNMTSKTAKKAVDLFFEGIKKQRKYLPTKKPFVAFYGGEPLMNFELIKFVIEYIKEKYSQYNCTFTITTNGLPLMRTKVAEYLIRNKVIICLSLDGYKENHDRNRVGLNSTPSYDSIISMVNEKFYNYPLIYSLCCFDYATDLEKLYDYYSKHDRYHGGEIPHVLRLSRIFDIGTNYYNQFNKDIIKNYITSYKKLEKTYIKLAIKDKSDWFLDMLMGQEHLRIYDRLKFSNGQSMYVTPGCCVPGEKIYVEPDGNLGVCEKTCIEGLSIGDVDTGLDYEKIIEIMNQMNSNFTEKCYDCEFRNLCSICYAHLLKPDEIGLTDKDCNQRKKGIIHSLEIIDYIEKRNPGYFERKVQKAIKRNTKTKSNIEEALEIYFR